jgi:hypothetical protein
MLTEETSVIADSGFTWENLSYQRLRKDLESTEKTELFASQTEGGILYGMSTRMLNVTLDSPIITKEGIELIVDGKVYTEELPSITSKNGFALSRAVGVQRNNFVPLSSGYQLNGVLYSNKELAPIDLSGAVIKARGLEAEFTFGFNNGETARSLGDNNFVRNKIHSYTATLGDSLVSYPDNFEETRRKYPKYIGKNANEMATSSALKGALLGFTVSEGIAYLATQNANTDDRMGALFLTTICGVFVFGMGFVLCADKLGESKFMRNIYAKKEKKAKERIMNEGLMNPPIVIGALSQKSMLDLERVQNLINERRRR